MVAWTPFVMHLSTFKYFLCFIQILYLPQFTTLKLVEVPVCLCECYSKMPQKYLRIVCEKLKAFLFVNGAYFVAIFNAKKEAESLKCFDDI